MIFLSYSSQDKQRVRPIAESLQASGYQVWWDEEIPAGRRFEKEIEAMLECCSAVIVLWSGNSVESEWVYEEADHGKRKNKLIPAFLDDCMPPMGFRMREGARLESWSGDLADIEWQGLLRSVEVLAKESGGEQLSRPAQAHVDSYEEAPSPEDVLDLHYDLSLSLEEAYSGKDVEVELPEGHGHESRRLSVRVPAGIDQGMRIRLTEMGAIEEGTGRKGDLYFVCDIADHPVFERKEADLYFTENIPLTTAILGGEVDVKMLDGSLIRVKIPGGTQPTTLMRLKERGMPDVHTGAKGDAYLEILVTIPSELSERAQELLLEFDEEVKKQAAHLQDPVALFNELFGDLKKAE